jgi:hypothetical protein
MLNPSSIVNLKLNLIALNIQLMIIDFVLMNIAKPRP